MVTCKAIGFQLDILYLKLWVSTIFPSFQQALRIICDWTLVLTCKNATALSILRAFNYNRFNNVIKKKRVSTVAIWWPSAMTKALQQRWWYSSTTSLDYRRCAMNKLPITISNYHVWPIPALRRTSPMLHFKTSFFSIFSPHALFFTFPVKQWFSEIAWWPSFSNRRKMVEIEGLEEGGGRDGTKVCYTFLKW